MSRLRIPFTLVSLCCLSGGPDLNGYVDRGQPVVVLSEVFSCFATDVIMEYSFARNYGLLQNANCLPNLRLCIQALMVSVHYVKYFPWLLSIMDMLPA